MLQVSGSIITTEKSITAILLQLSFYPFLFALKQKFRKAGIEPAK